jgi:hypothetical protein
MSTSAAVRPHEGKGLAYRRREPETTALYKIVSENLEPFLRFTRDNYSKPLPKYVQRELRNFLGCGVLSRGFTRILCDRCGKDMLVGLSCKGRGICPSCGGRRMAQGGAHAVDKVFPSAPVRQFVVTFPFELRPLLAAKAPVLSAVIRIVMRVVLGWYCEQARAAGNHRAEPGAICVLQRWGGSINVNPHLHIVAIDGTYTRASAASEPAFHFAAPPTKANIAAMLGAISARVCKMLRRRQLLGEANHESNEAEAIEAALDGCRKQALGRGRFERIDDRGCGQQALFADEPRLSRNKDSRWAADHDGFSLHAGVAFGALDRNGREKLVRYCLRPAISNERISVLRDGSIAYKLKHHVRGGNTHRVMRPLEMMARLAAIVPPPRLPLVRYHGCLAPSSSWRSSIAAGGVPAQTRDAGCPHASADKPRTRCNPQGESFARLPDEPKPARSRSSTSYIPWSELMKRTFGFDPLECLRCHAKMRPVALITKQHVVERILSHLRLPLRPEQLD